MNQNVFFVAFFFLVSSTVPEDIFHPTVDIDKLVITLGPYENAKNLSKVDASHQELLRLAKTVKNFKEVVGYNWTGLEILCNCTSSFCGTKDVVALLTFTGHPNTCIGQACYKQRRYFLYDGMGKKDEVQGCIGGSKEDYFAFHFNYQLKCRDKNETPHDMTHTRCCNSGFCQSNIADFPYPEPPTPPGWPLYQKLILGAVICVSLLVLGIVIVVLVKKCSSYRAQHSRVEAGRNGYQSVRAEPSSSSPNRRRYFETLLGDLDSNQPVDLERNDPVVPLESIGESSTCGPAFLAANQQSKLIRLLQIGQGRYGEVYKCLWMGQTVAAKVVHSRFEQSFFREKLLYKNGMRHANLLQFLGTDKNDSNYGVGECLIFEYHAQGSLDSFLRTQTVSVDQAVRMVYSMASGISFLHDPMGTPPNGKYAIAHRDIKSGNLLVKHNHMLCIADLGLALCLVDGKVGLPVDQAAEEVKEEEDQEDKEAKKNKKQNTLFCIPKKENKNKQVEKVEKNEANDKNKKNGQDKNKPAIFEQCGTMRYLPPELLNNTMEFEVFDSYKSADMFSASLVIYEICRRTQIDGEDITAPEEALPYFRQIQEAGGRVGCVDRDLMTTIVVNNKDRPDLSAWWNGNPAMRELCRLMEDCWAEDPRARLTANNVVRSIARMSARESIDVTQT